MDIDELLGEHSPEVAELAHRLLAHIERAADWSDQRIYAGWHGVGFHHSELGYVVGVFPRDDSVRVLFEHGHLLGPAPYLKGTGQTRHVDLATWEPERVAAIDDMIDRALGA